MEIPFSETYCGYVSRLPAEDVHQHYHDCEYGFPLTDDDALFGRLLLEINQAGLSWTLILKKKDHFYKAYDKFSIKKIARYDADKIAALLQNENIIRNRLKIAAAVHNARQVLLLQQSHGSFYQWLQAQGNLTREEWVKLFKKTFRFTGGEIVHSFLMSISLLPGAHHEDCPVYKKIKQLLKNP